MKTEEYIELWNTASSLQEIADKSGHKIRYCSNKARNLRKLGHTMRTFRTHENMVRWGRIGGKSYTLADRKKPQRGKA